MHEAGKLLLELDVNVEGTVEKPGTRYAGAVDIKSACGRGLDLGMVRETQVVVGTETGSCPDSITRKNG